MAAHPRPDAEPLHSLAEAAPGDLVEVVHILFGSLRQRFEDLGIRVGTRMRVRESGSCSMTCRASASTRRARKKCAICWRRKIGTDLFL